MRHFRQTYPLLVLLLTLCWTGSLQASACSAHTLAIEVLGSGGPELNDGRASSSYLLWQGGKARLLIDAGAGSALRFEQACARLEDLQAILFSHFHSDHSADFPSFAKAMYFSSRRTPLPVYGPTANVRFPDTEQFLQRLIGPQGAYAYLQDFLASEQSQGFYFQPHSLGKNSGEFQVGDITLQALALDHGPVPARAWKIATGNKTVLLTGDFSEPAPLLEVGKLDLLIAHHAIPEQAGRIAQQLHATPGEIGLLAEHLEASKLVLSHRMGRTFGRELQSLAAIRKHYLGHTVFAEDGACFALID